MEIWVKSIPFDKELITFCLERGISTFWVEDDVVERVRKLGRLRVVSEKGDLVPGRDFDVVEIEKREDLEALYEVPPDRIVYLEVTRADVIPVENLVAYGKRVFVPVASEKDALTFAGVLEKGVSGLVIAPPSLEEAGKILGVLSVEGKRVELTEADITEIEVLGVGDRVCVDTCSILEGATGMLVGNSSRGFFLVSAENVESEYVNPRPFRVNAGAVHMYTLLPDGRTAYLSELESGSPVLVVNQRGEGSTVWVGRVKVERRPMLLVKGMAGGIEISAVLQNAETIRLISPEGKQVSVAELSPGDRVLCHIEGGARHFGVRIEEKIEER